MAHLVGDGFDGRCVDSAGAVLGGKRKRVLGDHLRVESSVLRAEGLRK